MSDKIANYVYSYVFCSNRFTMKCKFVIQICLASEIKV